MDKEERDKILNRRLPDSEVAKLIEEIHQNAPIGAREARAKKTIQKDVEPNKEQVPALLKAHVMRPLLDEIENISKAALLKLSNHADRPLSEGAIEAKAVLSVTEHLLGFILSNGA